MEEHKATLKIGAVARLTGVSVHTLRKWEDRYGAVEPQRSPGGERVYTRDDLERLSLIKRLADGGFSLREIAPLSLADLVQARDQATQASGALMGRPMEKVNVAVLGGGVSTMISRQIGSSGHLKVIASAENRAALDEAVAGKTADVLVCECPTLQQDSRHFVSELIERFNVRGVVVVYSFGSRSDLSALQSANVVTLRAPADAAALEQAVASLVHANGVVPKELGAGFDSFDFNADAPPPRLSRSAITRVASVSPRIQCECPHHLADIILSLKAFEQYSAECEDRNAEDAELHHFLWRSAGQARALFEHAIERVAAAEGISLDD